MSKYMFTVRGNVNSEVRSLPIIATYIARKLFNIGVLNFSDVSLIRLDKKTYEYTFYANLHPAVTDYVAKKLLETFDLVTWNEFTLEQKHKWGE